MLRKQESPSPFNWNDIFSGGFNHNQLYGIPAVVVEDEPVVDTKPVVDAEPVVEDDSDVGACYACSTGTRLCDRHICHKHKSKNLPRIGCQKCSRNCQFEKTSEKALRFREIYEQVMERDVNNCRSVINKEATVFLLTRGINSYKQILTQEHPETKRECLEKRLRDLERNLSICMDRPSSYFLSRKERDKLVSKNLRLVSGQSGYSWISVYEQNLD